jgi:hypothetical protein
MTKSHPRAELDQPLLDRRSLRLSTDAEELRSPPDQQRVADRICSGQHQQPPRLLGQTLELAAVALLDSTRQRRRTRETEPTRQLHRRQPPRQFQQRQGIAPGFTDDAIPHADIDPSGNDRGHQRPRIVLAQPLDLKLRKACQFVAGPSNCEHQTDRLRAETPSDERQRLRRGPIEPLLVVDKAEERLLIGDLSQQAQAGERHHEAIRRRAATHAERRPQRVTLRNRQTVDALQPRRTELMQTSKRELHLGFHAHRAQDSTTRRLIERVVQQRRLAHTRLPAQHQRLALAPANGLDQGVEGLALATPPDQLRTPSSRPRNGGHQFGPDLTPRRSPSRSRRSNVWPMSARVLADPTMDGRTRR